MAAVTHDAPDSQQNLDAALKQFERAAHEAGAALDFRIDEDSQRLVVSVVDRGSGEVLRQIPSEEALRIARHLQGLQERSGALIAAVA
ncbi:MAG TPA: flagellar protein FlaG [Solimonas sp.]